MLIPHNLVSRIRVLCFIVRVERNFWTNFTNQNSVRRYTGKKYYVIVKSINSLASHRKRKSKSTVGVLKSLTMYDKNQNLRYLAFGKY